MKSADGKQNGKMATCRKDVVKLLKYFREEIKDEHKGKDEGFKSYHIKTLMLHMFDMYDRPEHWVKRGKSKAVRPMFKKCLQQLIQHLEDGKLDHYFLDVNLFQSGEISKQQRQFWIKHFNRKLSYY